MRSTCLIVLAICCWNVPRLSAQEFTKQALLVAPFRSDTGARAAATARDIADALRNRLGKAVDNREVRVLEQYLLGNVLAESDYKRSAVLGDVELRLVAGKLRADEIVHGQFTRSGTTLVVTARLARIRNWGMQQPLPTVRGTTAANVGDALATEVLKARAQLAGLRRCENALARGDRRTAAREAEGAIRGYPQAVIARDCLLSALFDGTIGADSILRVADDALAIDSTNSFAALSRAQALEALKRTREAVAQWNQLFAWHADSLPLGHTIVEAMLRLQQPTMALRHTQTLSSRFVGDPTLRRLAFRAHTALGQWTEAAILGDSLEAQDEEFRRDSNYATRYVEALRQRGDTLAAVELSVRNVRRFPGDSRLYLQYLQLVGMEQSAALPRGLVNFPEIPEMHLLAAQSARRAGNQGAAIRSLREAVRRDSTRSAQFLQLADLYVEAHALDSTVAILRRAPRSGESLEALRSYTLARGLMLFRAAADSAPQRQQAGMALLLLADTLASRGDSRSTIAAAALQVARAHLVMASRSRNCGATQQANETLRLTADAITRGLGDGDGSSRTEITSAYDAMRHAVDDALVLLCRPGDTGNGYTTV